MVSDSLLMRLKVSDSSGICVVYLLPVFGAVGVKKEDLSWYLPYLVHALVMRLMASQRIITHCKAICQPLVLES